MNKLKFIPIHYWDKKIMTLDDSPSSEQWDEVEKIAHSLNAKYSFEPGCISHPDRVQKFSIGLFNGHLDIQIVKSDTCQCHDIVARMIEIRNDESETLNPQR